MLVLDEARKERLRARGVENFLGAGSTISEHAVFEPPCSIKWMQIESAFSLGAFSYAVRGFFFDVHIGRYVSIGEAVQVGRSSHPLDWMSTSPFFYVGAKVFDIGGDFAGGAEYHAYTAPFRPGTTSTVHRPIHIGNDVYIGHGAMIMPGVRVGDGAVIGAMAVVTKDVPPYAVVAGNPATVRRMRHTEALAERLLALAWWRFAPWQLAAVDTSSPEAALDDLECIVASEAPYAPDLVRIADLAE